MFEALRARRDRRPNGLAVQVTPARFWLVAVCLMLALAGCRKYPEATHPDTIHFIAALRTACSARSQQWLEESERAIEAGFQQGNLTEREHTALLQIVQLARQGHWERAERACHQFQRDQLR